MTTTTMTRLQVFECTICGNQVEMLRVGGGKLVCCNQPMTSLTENTVDASREKHLPVIEQTPEGVKVTVGSIAHPMEDKHLIEWIELIADGQAYRQFLSPGQLPEAFFPVQATHVTVREHCNLHGLWKSEVGQ